MTWSIRSMLVVCALSVACSRNNTEDKDPTETDDSRGSGVNDPPDARDVEVTLTEDGSFALESFTDPNGDTLTVVIVVEPEHGTVSGEYPDLVYTPDPDFSGEDTVTLEVSDGVETVTVVVTFVVSPQNDAPVVVSTDLTTDEDTSVALSLSATDVDGDALTWSVVTDPTLGTLSGDLPGATYVPTPHVNGADSLVVRVNDGTVDVEVTIAVDITPVNDVPEATAASLTTTEDVPLDLTLEGVDVDGDALTFTVVTDPSAGTLSGTAPALTYTPNANQSGADAFTFTVSDGTATSTAATVDIAVVAAADAPTAEDLSLTVDEDGEVCSAVVAADADGEAITLAGTGSFASWMTFDGLSVCVKPEADVSGQFALTFEVTDAGGDTGQATINLTINPMQDPPTIVGETVPLAEDGDAFVQATVDDPDGDDLTCSVVTQGTLGTVELDGCSLSYTPNADANGTDPVVVQVSDGQATAQATFTFVISPVQDAPTLTVPAATTPEDTPIAITLPGEDADGEGLTYALVNGPSFGQASVDGDVLSYTPDADAFGADTVDVTVTDGIDTITVAVAIEVTPVNDAPEVACEELVIDEDTSGQVFPGAFDVDDDELVFTATQGPALGSLDAENVFTPDANANGSDEARFEVSDGTVVVEIVCPIQITPVNDAPEVVCEPLALDEDSSGQLFPGASDADDDELVFTVTQTPLLGFLDEDNVYTPGLNLFGSDEARFEVSDGTVSVEIVCPIVIASVNDLPVASCDASILDEDGVGSVTVFAYDPDDILIETDPPQFFGAQETVLIPPPLGSLTFAVTSEPALGAVTGEGPSFTFTPGPNLFGADSFDVTVSDGEGEVVVTCDVGITPVNDLPVVSCDPTVVAEDGQATLTVVASDVDEDTLTYEIVRSPVAADVVGEGPSYSFVPFADVFGSDEVQIAVSDGVASVTATCSVDVSPIPDPPVMACSALTINEDGDGVLRLNGYDPDDILDGPTDTFVFDTDVQGQDSFADTWIDTWEGPSPLPPGWSVTRTDGPASGFTEGDGFSWYYNPGNNFFGEDSLTFDVSDGDQTTTITCPLVVLPVNDPPQASCDAIILDEDGSASFALTLSDIEDDTLTVTPATFPLLGDLSGAEPTWTYTPLLNENGQDLIVFDVSDGTDTVQVSCDVQITPVNDPPVAACAPLSFPEDGSGTLTLVVSDPDDLDIVLGGLDQEPQLLAGPLVTVTAGPEFGGYEGGGTSYDLFPDNDFFGDDSMSFTVSDGLLSVPVTCPFTVTPVNDAPVFSCADVTLDEDVPATVVIRFSDVDGDEPNLTPDATPELGAVGSPTPNAEDAGALEVLYTPNADEFGGDGFSYTWQDGAFSGSVSCSVEIFAVNDPPRGICTLTTLNEDGSAQIFVDAVDIDGVPVQDTFCLEGCDTFSQGGGIFYDIETPAAFDPQMGNEGPTFFYNPGSDLFGADSFVVRVSDGWDSSLITCNVQVVGVNDAPVGSNSTAEVGSFPGWTVDLPTVATDAETPADELIYELVTPPVNGILSGELPNLIYDPEIFSGQDTIQWRVKDADGAQSPIYTVSITIFGTA